MTTKKQQQIKDRTFRSVQEIKETCLPALAKSEREKEPGWLMEQQAKMTARVLREHITFPSIGTQT